MKQILSLISAGIIPTLAPVMVLLVTLLTLVIFNGEEALSAEKAFVALALFNSKRLIFTVHFIKQC